ncbi:MAG TPA: hypothetical protein VEU33_23670 [Archangium sp.]|nr:hypothetical protein [Archangium sp.]
MPSSSLGSDWALSGLWLTDGRRAVSDLDNPNGDNLALALPSRCDDFLVRALRTGPWPCAQVSPRPSPDTQNLHLETLFLGAGCWPGN